MEMEKSHYEVLGIDEEASGKEVKKAFFRKVREHPPEQDPEGHKRIREAYDVLSDPVSRKEYDNMSSYGEQIEQLKKEAEALMQQDPPATGKAIPKLKKAIVLGPEIGILRNQLGNCYLAEDEPDEALAQFEKALSINEKNDSYRLNKGHALQAMGRLRYAERAFREVWEDDRGEYAAARGLANVLFEQEHIDQAHEVLEEAIWADGKRDFEDFFCYYDKLQLYIYEGRTDVLETKLEEVVGLADTAEDRQFAAFMLGRLAFQLYEINAYSLADRFVDAATNLDPDSPELQQLKDHTQDLRGLEESLEAIVDSDRIHDVVKHIMAVFYEQAVGGMSEVEAEKRIDDIIEGLDQVMLADPANTEIKRSLRRVKRRHPEAYELNADLFDAILSVGNATFRMEECPYCGDVSRLEKGMSGRGRCPSCNNEIRITSSGLKKVSHGSPSTSTSTSNDEGCFIATAVYGDYEHPDVMRLRAFRDAVLTENAFGRLFIRTYYQHGPKLARRLNQRSRISALVRGLLGTFVDTFLRRK